jgi:hypothetical protein
MHILFHGQSELGVCSKPDKKATWIILNINNLNVNNHN